MKIDPDVFGRSMPPPVAERSLDNADFLSQYGDSVGSVCDRTPQRTQLEPFPDRNASLPVIYFGADCEQPAIQQQWVVEGDQIPSADEIFASVPDCHIERRGARIISAGDSC